MDENAQIIGTNRRARPVQASIVKPQYTTLTPETRFVSWNHEFASPSEGATTTADQANSVDFKVNR